MAIRATPTSLIVPKAMTLEALKILNRSFNARTEYHARRVVDEPRKWKVVEVIVAGGDFAESLTKELATDLKRSQAEALVKLLRSNQKQGS